MRKPLIITLFHVLCMVITAQPETVITGRVSDSVSGDPLIGASVISGRGRGTVTDVRGIYSLSTREESLTLVFHYLGYLSRSLPLKTAGGDTLKLDVRMQPSVTMLDEIVVSAGRYEQRLSDVMVSVDVIKPERIANTNTMSLDAIIRQTPGVEILDGQPGIRGGAGYSYGAGSRVLVLMDDLPILTGDVGDVKWDYLPVENIEQVEIIKGASSVLYGSSALNGVFNIRSTYPVNVPRTKLSLFSGMYMEPERKEMIWSDRPGFFGGLEFSHRRKIRDLDLVLGGNLFRDEGYREDEYQDRGRMNLLLRQRSRAVKGMSYGINLNGMLADKSDFLIWRDAGPGAWRQNQLALSPLTGSRLNVDPFVEYIGRAGDRHSLKTRYFWIDNNFPDTPDKNNSSGFFYGEYRYQRKISQKVEASAGLAGTWANSVAALYGQHTSSNQAVFGQADASLLPSLKASLGLRFERYVLDGLEEYSTPVIRMGLNYRLTGSSYLRASFGQGYRFPSIAEKYTATNVGVLKIFPNPDLVSETGWSAELGFKQGLKISGWHGYFDLAAFWTEYSNMIEFVFDVYGPDSVPGLDDYGFKALNVGNARIAGFEVSMYGSGEIGPMSLNLMAGYTWLDPVDKDAADTAADRSSATLKYRYRHSLKSDAELGYKRFSVGLTFVLNSRMDRVDEVFVDPFFGNAILPGFPEYWKEYNRANPVLDARVLCNITPWLTVGLILKNALNREYLGRPGDIQPPRNITLRLTADF